jgi:hypothetical protein
VSGSTTVLAGSRAGTGEVAESSPGVQTGYIGNG